MKILLVNTLYKPYELGGAEFSTQILAEALANEHQVYVVTTGFKNKIARINGVIVIYLRIPHIFNRYDGDKKNVIQKTLWRIYEYANTYPFYLFRELIKRIEPQIIHTNNIASFTPRIWKAASEQKAKVVHTTRDYYLICAKSSMMKRGKSCSKQCAFCKFYTGNFQKYTSYVDDFVFISNYIKSKHQRFLGIDGPVIHNAAGNIEEISKEDGKYSEDKLTIGYIGSISKLKGVDRILRIAKKIKINTILAGNIVDEGSSIEHLINSNEYVSWLGFVDKEDFFKKIDVLLHLPRWEEPMGRTVVESLAYGIPVITLRKGGLKDLLEDGKDGFYINESSYLEEVERLFQYLKRPETYKKISDSARLSAKKYSTERYVQDYLEVYNR